jgi:serine/threonine protein kinase/Tol biopolymer transport system component
MIGKTLGHYRVGEQLGRGGMGEVYVADDLSLDRKVALKFLPDAFTGDPERMARFEREARLLASLNHPNIAAIYGLEQAEGKRFIVMELVEGESLAQRLSKGALPLDEALGICRQIAEGLEAAHEKGVIHRDLKPANVMVSEGDKVKILDFGLAKALSGETQSVSASQSPTITEAMTQPGVILGTAAYMSPEQAKGKSVDKRADIWAFGCVLYECLVGKKVFEGETVTEMLASILKTEPNWQALPESTPTGILMLLRRCLEKTPGRRLRDVADIQIIIEEAGDVSRVHGRQEGRPWFEWFIGAILLTALGFALWAPWRVAKTAREVTRSFLDVTSADYLQSTSVDQKESQGHLSRNSIALTPDGRTVVFSAARGDVQQIYARKLDRWDAFPITGTEGGNSPFISPDGMWVGFWAAGSLKKAPLGGEGLPTVICQTYSIFGASWGTNGTIVLAHAGGGLWQVPESGGDPKSITELDKGRGELSHRLPQMLPGGTAVIFTVTHTDFPTWNDTDIVVQSLITKERKVLIKGGADGRYVSTGHLLYVSRGILMAVPFDLKTLTVRGGGVILVNDLMQSANMVKDGLDSGAGQFAVSEGGSFAYVQGTIYKFLERSLAWVDRTGKIEPLAAGQRAYVYPRLSPDGKRILVATQGDRNIWMYDILRGNAMRLTVDGRNMAPAWTPDGRRAIYGSSITGSGENLFWKPVDGSADAERLTDVSGRASFVSPDGNVLFFIQGNDIWRLSLVGDRNSSPVFQTKENESDPDLSPDGKWLAYTSNKSGRREVYVRQYPGSGADVLVSTEGGEGPSWKKDGRELYYLAPALSTGSAQFRMMAVTVTAGPSFSAERPKALFSVDSSIMASSVLVRSYDVTADGKRFLMVQQKERPPIKPTRIVLIQNWFEELKRLVPTEKK